MEQQILNSIFRAAFAYFLVMFLTRIMGRKIISQMTFFDFVVGISLGSATASLAIGPNNSTISAATVLISFAFLTITTGYFHIKSFKGRKLVNSEPVTMIANGKIMEKNMKKIRLSINDLMMLLREKNIFNISDVEFALMETDGKLSVLPKSQKQPITPADLKLPTTYKGLMKDIIIDGQVMYENLQDANLNEQWLYNELLTKGIKQPQEVFYAGLDTAGNLYVSIQKDEREKQGKYGLE